MQLLDVNRCLMSEVIQNPEYHDQKTYIFFLISDNQLTYIYSHTF